MKNKVPSLDKQKYDYLIDRFEFKLKKGFNPFKAKCELCEEIINCKLRISKNFRPYEVTLEGASFHHDSDREIHLLCYICHKKLHDLGVILRWLEKIGKKFEDLPDTKGLNPWGG